MSRGIILFFSLFFFVAAVAPSWGFFGHRRINRMAVFTLPQDMLRFYKTNIEFITEHAIDPDKRRYATKHEGVRHYIDIDHWDVAPFNAVDRHYGAAILDFASCYILKGSDTLFYNLKDPTVEVKGLKGLKDSLKNKLRYLALNKPDEMPWAISLDQYGVNDTLHIKDNFSEYGILPYWLLKYQQRLTQAFIDKDAKRILRISAEIGHYISDAHVPLHTTENYNGAMTNQVGIHAFWESRIPELFADKEYDYFVGKANYIEDLNAFFWKMVLDSHDLVDEVLDYEKELSELFPTDQQWCYDERLGRTIRIQCPDYTKAYEQRMAGMVEERMRASIHAVASSWYTAWVNAGQPTLEEEMFKNTAEDDVLDRQFKANQIKGRDHDNGKG